MRSSRIDRASRRNGSVSSTPAVRGDARFSQVLERLEPRRLMAIPAFPEAEGFGANAAGGRGGDVYRVTNLNDSGPGSLRDGISTAAGPRTIVFEVAGTIRLLSDLNFTKPFMTVAGQTAPGDGITIADRMTRVTNTNNVVLRHIRFRPGDTNTLAAGNTYTPDSLWVAGSTNVMIDHVSASWSVDETLSVTAASTGVSVQWSFITESLRNAGHPKGSHGYGSLINGGQIAYHHNLYAHHDSRNPRPGTADSLPFDFDFRNNVVYDWGMQAGYNGLDGDQTLVTNRLNMNYVGNYLVAGPSTSSSKLNNAFLGGMVRTNIFQSGNKIDGNRNKVRDGTNTGWSMFSGTYTQIAAEHQFNPAVPITTQTVDAAYASVLANSGARPWNRDAVDARVALDVRNETGGIIDSQNQVGGWPTLAGGTVVDTDRDGMPDEWELTQGYNPNAANNNADPDGDGYTQLEDYLNGYAVRMDRAAPNLASTPTFRFDTAPQQLRLAFNEPIARSKSAALITVRNTTTNAVLPASAYTVSVDAATNALLVTFASPVPNGSYAATLPRYAVVDAAGNPLAADATAAFTFVRGDMNRDGAVNNLDIAPFVQGLTNAAGFRSQFGYAPTLLGDVNNDGAFNNLDIAPLVALLTGTGTTATGPVSEGVRSTRLPTARSVGDVLMSGMSSRDDDSSAAGMLRD
jgi:pectate lyase